MSRTRSSTRCTASTIRWVRFPRVGLCTCARGRPTCAGTARRAQRPLRDRVPRCASWPLRRGSDRREEGRGRNQGGEDHRREPSGSDPELPACFRARGRSGAQLRHFRPVQTRGLHIATWPGIGCCSSGEEQLTRITRITRTRSGGINGWRRASYDLCSCWELPRDVAVCRIVSRAEPAGNGRSGVGSALSSRACCHPEEQPRRGILRSDLMAGHESRTVDPSLRFAMDARDDTRSG